MTDRRPFLNMRSRVILQTPLDLPEDLVKQFDAEYKQDEHLNRVIFPDDRLSVRRLTSFNQNMSQEGYDLFSTDLFVWSNIVSEGEITEAKTLIRGSIFDGVISLEIPADRAYTRGEIREAFEPASVDIVRSDFTYILTPKDSVKFFISNGTSNFHLEALDKLGIKQSNAIYASGVKGKISKGKSGFF